MPSPRKSPDRRQNHKTKDLEIVDDEGVVIEIPPPPSKLQARARDLWVAFFQSPVAQAIDIRSDLHRVERWVYWADQFERAKADLDENGVIGIGSTGNEIMSPMAKWMLECENQLQRAERALGLSPRARNELGLVMNLNAMTSGKILKELDLLEDEDLDAAIEATWRQFDE